MTTNLSLVGKKNQTWTPNETRPFQVSRLSKKRYIFSSAVLNKWTPKTTTSVKKDPDPVPIGYTMALKFGLTKKLGIWWNLSLFVFSRCCVVSKSKIPWCRSRSTKTCSAAGAPLRAASVGGSEASRRKAPKRKASRRIVGVETCCHML